jgi:hypothetical protein
MLACCVGMSLFKALREEVGSELPDAILSNEDTTEAGVLQQRKSANADSVLKL